MFTISEMKNIKNTAPKHYRAHATHPQQLVLCEEQDGSVVLLGEVEGLCQPVHVCRCTATQTHHFVCPEHRCLVVVLDGEGRQVNITGLAEGVYTQIHNYGSS